MEFTADYFIKFFQSIPPEKWTRGAFKRGDGSRCALGHLDADDGIGNRIVFVGYSNITGTPTTKITPIPAAQALIRLFEEYMHTGPVTVNDSSSDPRSAILESLYKIKEMRGEPMTIEGEVVNEDKPVDEKFKAIMAQNGIADPPTIAELNAQKTAELKKELCFA